MLATTPRPDRAKEEEKETEKQAEKRKDTCTTQAPVLHPSLPHTHTIAPHLKDTTVSIYGREEKDTPEKRHYAKTPTQTMPKPP